MALLHALDGFLDRRLDGDVQYPSKALDERRAQAFRTATDVVSTQEMIEIIVDVHRIFSVQL